MKEYEDISYVSCLLGGHTRDASTINMGIVDASLACPPKRQNVDYNCPTRP
jgi:hypothetical protein